jgi:pimeloyl-ACP methyl ester carboxylesterase
MTGEIIMRRPSVISCCGALAGLYFTAVSFAASQAARETHPGLTTSYETLTLRDGVRLQNIITKPANVRGRLPAIQFVQWLSCDSVGISTNASDGWSGMLRQIVRESNALVWRTEKRGIGGSEGTCDTMDYDTELADHRDAFAALKRRPDVDPRRIVIFGGSIGGTYAPLIAADQEIAGVITWGAGATTWAERMLKFERNALELGGVDPTQLAGEMTARFQFLDRYLIKGETPAQIAAADASLGAVWTRIVGTSPTGHYERPFAFHQQAQRADWAGAWSRVRAPVLAVYGEYDWFESRDAASLIARIVNATSPGRGTFVEIPAMNHHFSEFRNAADAFTEKNGKVNPDPAVKVMLQWLQTTFNSAGR